MGQLKSSLICDKCGHCSVTFDPFWDLALPIPTNRSASSDIDIYDCFKHFTKKEVMDGDERPVKKGQSAYIIIIIIISIIY